MRDSGGHHEPFDQVYLDFLFESSPDALVMADVNGHVVRVNDEFVRLFGYRTTELSGQRLDAMIVPHDRLEEAASLTRRVASGERVTLDTIRSRKDGSAVHVMTSGIPMRVRGEVRGVCAVYRDLTERHQIQLDKQISDRRLRLVTENALDIIMVLAGDGRIQYISPSVRRVLGYEPEERIGRAAFELIHVDDVLDVEGAFIQMLGSPGPGQPIEFRHAHRDGSWRMLEAVPNNLISDPAVGAIVITLRDVTDRRLAEEALRVSQERLAHEALHDALTGLPNRAYFMDRLDECIARAHRRKDDLFAVLFLDLDRFKVVNDSLGHLTGDLLLTAIARRLETCLRPGDSVARLGGDEFTILLDHLEQPDDAMRVADRVEQSLAEPFNLNGHEVYTGASVGIALSTSGYARAEDCLRDADTAMYRAKSKGRGRYEVFDRSMHQHAVSLLQLETDLRRAIGRGELFLQYQPIVCLQDECLAGFEALLRWKHPEKGIVMPETFIALAEETGLILPIGSWVIGEACRQVRHWRNTLPMSEDLSVSVNLSARQFEQPDLVERVADALQECGLDGSALKLEITETVLMANAEASNNVLSRLRKLGVQVQVDDFGTGYSSLSYLHRFKIDTLKIDRSFVGGLAGEGEPLEIVRSIITLGRNLGVAIVAEGVETIAQLDTLRDLGCEYVQGYLFAHPLNEDTASEMLSGYAAAQCA